MSASADPVAVRRAVAQHEGLEDAGNVEVVESHISWLFLTQRKAFKLKKPLRLAFLDYSTPERRRLLCAEEVRLNSRLAPDIYLGVRALRPSAGGIEIVMPDDPAAVDYLVEMNRYDEDQTLSALVSRGDARAEELDALGRTLAEFHSACREVPGEHGAESVLNETITNAREFRELIEVDREQARLDSIERFIRRFVDLHRTELDRRAADGRTREGHGDLRAEHVLLRPAIRVVDCVEFDLDLRTLDVADDLAFLIMELAAMQAGTLVPPLLRGYRGAGGDCGTDQLLGFFAVHRALVRGKVHLVRARQLGSAEGRAQEYSVALGFIDLAERLCWRARGPLVLAVCGVPASGKSHLARHLRAVSGLPIVSSDIVRKELAGLEPTDRGGPDVYTRDANESTYAELGRRAARALDAEPGVLVDATFRRREDRDSFRAQLADRSPIMFLECRAPQSVLADRAVAREGDPERVSDATAVIAERERHTWEPLNEVAPEWKVALQTDRPIEQVAADLMEALDGRPYSAGTGRGTTSNGQ